MYENFKYVEKVSNKKTAQVFKWAKDLNRHLSKEYIQLPRKQIKRCLPSLVINGTQTKITGDTTSYPLRGPLLKPKIKKKQVLVRDVEN